MTVHKPADIISGNKESLRNSVSANALNRADGNIMVGAQIQVTLEQLRAALAGEAISTVPTAANDNDVEARIAA